MGKGVFRSFLSVVLMDKAAVKFAIGVVCGLGFSISVILSTFGIMDGFETTLKSGLKKSAGDLIFYSRNGFFQFDDEAKEILSELKVKDYAPMVQTEGFVIKGETSRGVLVKGVMPESFQKVMHAPIELGEGDVALGVELGKVLQVKPGDEVVLAFASGNRDVSGLPLLKRFRISGFVNHGVYQKDMRLLYIRRSELQLSMGIKDRVNVVALNIPEQSENSQKQIDNIKDFVLDLEDRLGYGFLVKPFWSDFRALFTAVKAEKGMISLILQLVVVISIFNVLAFIIFLNEKRSREIFLFKALGLSQKKLMKTWFGVILLLWFFSCLLSIVLVKIFGWLLGYLSILELPGDIYYMGRFSIVLDNMDYMLVFSLSLVWLILVSLAGLYRIMRKSILHGLRKEFA